MTDLNPDSNWPLKRPYPRSTTDNWYEHANENISRHLASQSFLTNEQTVNILVYVTALEGFIMQRLAPAEATAESKPAVPTVVIVGDDEIHVANCVLQQLDHRLDGVLVVEQSAAAAITLAYGARGNAIHITQVEDPEVTGRRVMDAFRRQGEASIR
jgi:hypothetical protein